MASNIGRYVSLLDLPSLFGFRCLIFHSRCSLLLFALRLVLLLAPEVLHGCEQYHLSEGNQLSEDQPYVDHLRGAFKNVLADFAR